MAKEIDIRIKVLTDGIKRGAKAVEGRMRAMAGAIKSSFKRAGDFIKANWLKVTAGVAAAAGGLGAAVKKAFEFETAERGFAVLLGSADEAKKRIKELSDFAAATPFELENVIKASRQLTAFSEGALGSAESIKLVGDAAAAANAPIEEVSFWVGRAYSAIQSGKPFGEAAMRLQELTILGGKARNRLEDLQKSGASNTEIWNAFQQELRKSEGAMLGLSTTGAGLFSTLKGEWSQALADFGMQFLDVSKNAIGGMIATLKALRDDGSIARWAENAKLALLTVKDTALDLAGLLKGRTFGETRQLREDRANEARIERESQIRLAALQEEKRARIKAELEADVARVAALDKQKRAAVRAALEEQQINDETAKKKMGLLEREKQLRISIALELLKADEQRLVQIEAERQAHADLHRDVLKGIQGEIDERRKGIEDIAAKEAKIKEDAAKRVAAIQRQIDAAQERIDAEKEQKRINDMIKEGKKLEQAAAGEFADLGFDADDADKLAKKLKRVRERDQRGFALSKRDKELLDADKKRERAARLAEEAQNAKDRIKADAEQKRLDALADLKKQQAAIRAQEKIDLQAAQIARDKAAVALEKLLIEQKGVNASLKQLLQLS